MRAQKLVTLLIFVSHHCSGISSPVLHCTLRLTLLLLALQGYSGVTSYVQKAYSPVSAEADSLAKAAADESGDDDTFDEQLDREGRCVGAA